MHVNSAFCLSDVFYPTFCLFFVDMFYILQLFNCTQVTDMWRYSLLQSFFHLLILPGNYK